MPYEYLKVPAPGVLIHVGTSQVDRVYIDIDDDPYWIVVETSGRTKSIRRVTEAEMKRIDAEEHAERGDMEEMIQRAEEAGLTRASPLHVLRQCLLVGHVKARAIQSEWRLREAEIL